MYLIFWIWLTVIALEEYLLILINFYIVLLWKNNFLSLLLWGLKSVLLLEHRLGSLIWVLINYPIDTSRWNIIRFFLMFDIKYWTIYLICSHPSLLTLVSNFRLKKILHGFFILLRLIYLYFFDVCILLFDFNPRWVFIKANFFCSQVSLFLSRIWFVSTHGNLLLVGEIRVLRGL